jgi:hypothetical protein
MVVLAESRLHHGIVLGGSKEGICFCLTYLTTKVIWMVDIVVHMEEADRIWALCTALRIGAEVGGVRLLVD